MTRPIMEYERPPRRASEWLTEMLERPDDEALRQSFEAWLAADPAHAEDWSEIARTYEVLGRTAPTHRGEWAAYAATHGGSRPLPQPTSPRARLRRRRVLTAAAAAVAACLALFALPDVLLRLEADHVTATGETRTIGLDDGSTVRLGPESAIAVAHAGHERGVRLIRGTAYFEVKPDETRPFRVKARQVETTVLGTAFEVRMEELGAAVAVRHGAVGVENGSVSPPVSVRLAAGNWVRLAWTGETVRGSSPPEQVAAWTQGRLIAKDLPVGQAVDRLRPYYDGLIVLRGARLAEQPLTGVYNLADPVAALKAVASAQNAAVYQISPWLLVLAGD